MVHIGELGLEVIRSSSKCYVEVQGLLNYSTIKWVGNGKQ